MDGSAGSEQQGRRRDELHEEEKQHEFVEQCERVAGDLAQEAVD